METRSIGSLAVSAVGIGCNNFGWHIDEEQSQGVVDAALNDGINFFDTADSYGGGESEKMLGRALGARRSEVVIASKFAYQRAESNASPDYVREACEASLQRLDTDYLDLYYLHKPDPAMPITETLGALTALKKEGKVREIACSNFSVQQLREAADADTDAHFVGVQNEYNLLERAPEEGVLDTCSELGLAFIPYFPLKSGLLTGKYRKDDTIPAGSRLNPSGDSHFSSMGKGLLTEENLNVVEDLISFAESRGHTILELAFSWLLAHEPVTSVIAGATKPKQVHTNADAASWNLTNEERAEVDRLTSPETVA